MPGWSITDLQGCHFHQVIGVEEEFLQYIVNGSLWIDQFLTNKYKKWLIKMYS